MSRVRRLGLLAAALAAAALASGTGRADSQELWRDALDRADRLGTRITADPGVASAGAAAIRIETAWPTVINLAEVTDLEVDGAVLVYAAELRSRDLQGSAYLEMWCHFADGRQYFSRGFDSTIGGTADWRRLETRFILQAGQKPDKVTLNLAINGRGTVWIDDLRLARQPLPE